MIDIILNYGFAWVAVLPAILLAFKFVANRLFKTNERLIAISQGLTKTHIPLGVLLICIVWHVVDVGGVQRICDIHCQAPQIVPKV